MLWIFGEERSSAAVKETDRHGNGSLNLPESSCLYPESFIFDRANASPSNTQGGSPVRESRTPGSGAGVLSNEHPYRDWCFGFPLLEKKVKGRFFGGLLAFVAR
jgi:hypothetical protein